MKMLVRNSCLKKIGLVHHTKEQSFISMKADFCQDINRI